MESRIRYSKDLIKKTRIIDAKFPPGIHPHTPHKICFVRAEAGELNELCKDCVFSGKSKYSCLATKLGANGYMHTKGDGLEPAEINPKMGINLKIPITKIVEKGEAWVCHNPEAGAKGIYLLNDKVPPCKYRVKREGKKGGD